MHKTPGLAEVTAPLPHDDALPASRKTPSASRAARRMDTLARKWAYLISTTAYLPHTPAEIENELSILLGWLFEAVVSDPVGTEEAAAAGGRLVELGCVGPDSLRCTMEVLGKGLLREPELRRLDNLAERVVVVLGALSAGYGETLREDIQKKQEGLSRALLKIEQETRRKQVITRAQFEEVFAGSASGVALTGLDGRILRANAALAKTLNRTPAEITALSLFDLIHPDEVDQVRADYRDLAQGKQHRLRLGRRLIGKDGEPMWATFAGAVVRDATGEANQLITIIDDDTEVSLLQRRLSHQALHDALTGLPNRQCFTSRMENVLRQADPATGVTLYHLDLDGFSLITDGLGQELGDRLLKSVAAKLKSVVEGENAIVARLGADEFAVLIQNKPTTPDMTTIVRQINHELTEAEYLDGHHGVAVSASIGVVHRPPRDIAPSELLRASDMTLRRAQANGNRQWELFDRVRESRERHEYSLAASMAGAWENGEIQVVYRPQVRLADDEVVGVEARLRWNHPREGRLPHETCVRLADETGLILPLGGWLLRTACEQVSAAGVELPVTVGLTAHQAADPDLVGEIRRILDDTGLAPDRLRPGFPVKALLADGGDAVDNLRVLADIGVPVEIHDFGSAGDVECLEDLPVQRVRIASRLVERRPERANPLVARSLDGLMEIAHLAGVAVTVDGVESYEQAAWWQQHGGDLASGALFLEMPTGLPAL
jgi:diguanylate cyclase (GGDEF)-like protein/PAS domain S-box-containing protein